MSGSILWALQLEYHGGNFVGWQRQQEHHGFSVQAVLEAAASKLNNGATTPCTAAGRTDAGVHASGQVVQLALPDRYDAGKVRDALNFHMQPHRATIRHVLPAPEGWHARFSATARHYRYTILNRRARPALLDGLVWHIERPLDDQAMAEAAQRLLGLHDFSAFRAGSCQAKSPIRTLDHLSVTRDGAEVVVIAQARAFLHHQVRNMVGTLSLVGAGKWRPDDVTRALQSRDRTQAGPTAPPDGLVLTNVLYQDLHFPADDNTIAG